jgi:hypothetical protein
MPRRTKIYVGPCKTLINGGRTEETRNENEVLYETTLRGVQVDISHIRHQVANHISNFEEVSQLKDRDQFIKDLADECASASTMRLDHLTKGTRTKPDEWTSQVLLRGLASVMERHGVKPAISEYERGGELRRSVYLRMAPGLLRIVGLNASKKDIKGLARRAKRIDHSSYSPPKHDFSHKRPKTF